MTGSSRFKPQIANLRNKCLKAANVIEVVSSTKCMVLADGMCAEWSENRSRISNSLILAERSSLRRSQPQCSTCHMPVTVAHFVVDCTV